MSTTPRRPPEARTLATLDDLLAEAKALGEYRKPTSVATSKAEASRAPYSPRGPRRDADAAPVTPRTASSASNPALVASNVNAPAEKISTPRVNRALRDAGIYDRPAPAGAGPKSTKAASPVHSPETPRGETLAIEPRAIKRFHDDRANAEKQRHEADMETRTAAPPVRAVPVTVGVGASPRAPRPKPEPRQADMRDWDKAIYQPNPAGDENKKHIPKVDANSSRMALEASTWQSDDGTTMTESRHDQLYRMAGHLREKAEKQRNDTRQELERDYTYKPAINKTDSIGWDAASDAGPQLSHAERTEQWAQQKRLALDEKRRLAELKRLEEENAAMSFSPRINRRRPKTATGSKSQPQQAPVIQTSSLSNAPASSNGGARPKSQLARPATATAAVRATAPPQMGRGLAAAAAAEQQQQQQAPRGGAKGGAGGKSLAPAGVSEVARPSGQSQQVRKLDHRRPRSTPSLMAAIQGSAPQDESDDEPSWPPKRGDKKRTPAPAPAPAAKASAKSSKEVAASPNKSPNATLASPRKNGASSPRSPVSHRRSSPQPSPVGPGTDMPPSPRRSTALPTPASPPSPVRTRDFMVTREVTDAVSVATTSAATNRNVGAGVKRAPKVRPAPVLNINRAKITSTKKPTKLQHGFFNSVPEVAADDDDVLERIRHREALIRIVIHIQRVFRGHMARKRYNRMRPKKDVRTQTPSPQQQRKLNSSGSPPLREWDPEEGSQGSPPPSEHSDEEAVEEEEEENPYVGFATSRGTSTGRGGGRGVGGSGSPPKARGGDRASLTAAERLQRSPTASASLSPGSPRQYAPGSDSEGSIM